jgi:hypothetical protein
MGLPKRKPEPIETPLPQFRVVGREEPPVAAATPPPKGKISLGGLNKAAPKKDAGKTHPVAVATDELQQTIAQFCDQKPQLDALEGSVKMLRQQILDDVTPQILASPVTEFSMLVNGPIPEVGQTQNKVLVTLQDRYTGADYETGFAAILAAIGPELAAEYFEQGISLTIKLADVPDDRRQALIDELLPIFDKHRVMGGDDPQAVNAVTAKEIVVPKPLFHAMRRGKLTIAQNLAIHAVLPCIGMVKNKNVKQ